MVMKLRMKVSQFQDTLGVLGNLNKILTMIIRPHSIQFQSLDSTKVALVQVTIPDSKLIAYTTDYVAAQFSVNVEDLMQDISKGTVGGEIHMVVDDKKMTVKTKFFTSEYLINKQVEKDAEFKEFGGEGQPSFRLPEEIFNFLKVLLNRKIEKVIIQHTGEKMILFGESARKYTVDVATTKCPPMGTTTVSVLWLTDILNSIKSEDIDIRFSSFGNLFIDTHANYGGVHAILAGTVRKLEVPVDVPKIDLTDLEGKQIASWDY